MTTKLPGARADLISGVGPMSPEYYRYLLGLENQQAGNAQTSDITAINASIEALQAQVNALPTSSGYPTLQITAPLTSSGLLQNGFAQLGVTVANSVVVNASALQLDGDADSPGNTFLYSTGVSGVKGWNALSGMVSGTSGNIDATINADGTVTFNLATVIDSGAGTFKLLTRDSFGRLSGTADGTTSDVPEGSNLYYTDARADARIALTALQKANNLSDVSSAPTALANLGGILKGYIDGLQMQWVSGTAITITTGTAYIPGLATYLQVNSSIALTGLTLSASTWYHLYLYSNSGTPAVECVTTAPTLYYGTAYQKTGDNTRRYIGSVRAGSSGIIYSFIHMADGFVRYLESTMSNGTEFQVYSGNATTPTTIPCSDIVPPTGFNAQLHSDNNSQQQMAFSNSMANFTLSGSAALHISSFLTTSFTERLIFTLPLDRSQAFEFMYLSTPSSTASLRILGYWYQR